MTVRELILYIKEDAFETFIWFGEGSEKLWSFNFLDLTIGQMVFTLIIVGTSCKLALDELRNESKSLFSERNKNFASYLAFPFFSSLIMFVVYEVYLY